MDADMLAVFMIEEEAEEDEMISMYARHDANELYKTRKSEGHFVSMIQIPLKNDKEMFTKLFRLNPQQSNFVLSSVGEDLARKSTNAVQEPIDTEEKLAITVRYVG
ncbi:hypothetical protein PR048_017245 [Dryococelus australis]|uniref:Uncharacterized protein n=1 Tax=Dryococelus australis TaxID=614101 RepID=A0ABQ9H8Z7_9NEOP|nr:hypothetical protein PR048_017245 [Dryococelus australis]